MAALTYKCPNCGGSMVFDPKKQKFVCEYCLSVFDSEAPAEPVQENPASEPAQENPASEPAPEEALLYTCPSCGAELAMEKTTAAGICYYCHNPVVLSGKLSGNQTPSLVIPFQISDEEARERFLSWIGHKKYIPAAFFSPKQIEKLSGVYFPYWICDCTLQGTLQGTARNIRVWRSGDTEYTETKVYSIRRFGQVRLAELSRNALQKAQVRMLEGILPFDMKKAEPFHTRYLSGFQAEIKDLEKETFETELEKEAEGYVKKLLSDTVTGHTGFSAENFHAEKQKAAWHYVLLPVWILTYQNKNELYYFSMNGQTGRICGRLPLDYRKLASVCTGIFAAVTILITLPGGFHFLALFIGMLAGAVTALGAFFTIQNSYRLTKENYYYPLSEKSRLQLTASDDILINQFVTHRKIPQNPPSSSGRDPSAKRTAVRPSKNGRTGSGRKRKL